MGKIIKRSMFGVILLLASLFIVGCRQDNIKNYTLNLDPDGGVLTSELIIEFDTKNIPVLPSPTKEGYDFDGWYLNDTLISDLKNNLPNESIFTLKAKWTKAVIGTLNASISKDYLHIGDEATIYIDGYFDASLLNIELDSDIVSIDNWLNVVAIKEGTVKISISLKSDPSKKATIKLEVLSKKPQIYSMSNRVSVGNKLYFNLRNLSELKESSIDEFIWSVNDESLAVINEDYSITALKTGTVTLYAKSKLDERISSNIFIEIVDANEVAVMSTPNNEYIYKTGDLIKLDILGEQKNNTFVWGSSDLEVLRIREDGYVIAVTSGKATISIYQEDNTKNRTYYEITVIENPDKNIDYIGNLLSMALSQNGYKEGKDNDNKFGIWYNNNHQPWCAMFVSWCWFQTGLSNELLLKYQGCSTGQQWCIEKGIFHYKESYRPKPGDIIFFEGHTGICAFVEGEYMYTIEGNASNRVGVWRWALNNSRIIGYASPDYPDYNGSVKDFSFLAGKDEFGNYYWTNASGNQSTT